MSNGVVGNVQSRRPGLQAGLIRVGMIYAFGIRGGGGGGIWELEGRPGVRDNCMLTFDRRRFSCMIRMIDVWAGTTIHVKAREPRAHSDDDIYILVARPAPSRIRRLARIRVRVRRRTGRGKEALRGPDAVIHALHMYRGAGAS